MDRAAKAESITELNGVFKTSNVVVVAHYSGLSVAQMQTLRKQMKQAGAQVKVAKNRLAQIALKDTDAAVISPLLKGPTVLAFSGDPVAAPKVAIDFAKANEKFVITAGALPNQVMSAKDIVVLATMPSREELLSKLMGTMQAPVAKLARTLNEVPAKFVRTLAAVQQAKEKAGA